MLRLGKKLAGIRWHFTLVSPHPLALNSLARPPPVSLGSHCAMIGKKLIVLEIKHCLTKRLLKSPTIHRTFQIGKEINAGTNKTGVDQKRSGELWARRGNTWVAFDQVASHCIEAMVASISFQTTVTLYSQPHPPSPKLYSSISPSSDPSPRVTAGKRYATRKAVSLLIKYWQSSQNMFNQANQLGFNQVFFFRSVLPLNKFPSVRLNTVSRAWRWIRVAVYPKKLSRYFSCNFS